MFSVNGNPILVSEISILEELRDQALLNQGVELFGPFKTSGQNIMFRCPIHNDGQERKPSCGISTADGKTKAGTVHCFSCGYTATLEEMISYVFGKDDNGYFGRHWLTKNFQSANIEDRPALNLNLSRDKILREQKDYVTEDVLDTYRYFHPYMYERGLTNKTIEIFDVGYDGRYKLKNGNVVPTITFPVRDIQGRTLFVARRAVKHKFFHYPENVIKPLYGIYELPQYFSYTAPIYVTESIFNCLTLWEWGYPAVSLMGTGTQFQYDQLRELSTRKLIVALDPDVAGQKATERLISRVDNKLISKVYYEDKSKDINDLTYKEFKSLLIG